jgi:long-chain acyl-CoA synthetase
MVLPLADSFWDVFEASATRFAGRTAVEFRRRGGVDAFTYKELHTMASARALWLRSVGVRHGDRCAILAPDDAHWCAAYLGILKAGATAIPLDPSCPVPRIRAILAETGARVVFVGARPAAAGREPLGDLEGVTQLDLHADAAGLPDATVAGPAARAAPGTADTGRGEGPATCRVAPAVILYTSGTSSDPKGVVLTHANLIAACDAALHVVAVTDRDVVLAMVPLFHSLSQLMNLLLPFTAGARVVFLASTGSTGPADAPGERQITILTCGPRSIDLMHERVMRPAGAAGALTRLLFRGRMAASRGLRRAGINAGALLFRRVHDQAGRRLRLLIAGGARLAPAVGRDLHALGFTIVQVYGLTETSGAATVTALDDASFDTAGRPMPGVEIKLVDTGAPACGGEIAIRGPVVMQGYLDRPEATTAVMHDGWLRTGDLGCLDDGGRLTITGRKDSIIVLASGQSIHPEEIEAHYRQCPYVKEICVIGLPASGQPVAERLHALVVPDAELMRARKIVNIGDLLRFEMEGLAAGLEPHKRVLSYDVSFELLPRTTMHTIKRHEAAKRVRDRHEAAAAGDTAVMTEAERVWTADAHAAAASALIAPRLPAGAALRPSANLELDLGLDSMERVELLMELEQHFGVRVPTAAACEIFTVAQLADAVRPLPGREGSEAGKRSPGPQEAPWAVLLRDVPPATNPSLAPLLERRRLAAPILFAAARLLRGCLARVRVTGLDRLPARGAWIMAPNHQSYLDPFLLCSVLPYDTFRRLFFVGAVEYFETPLTRWLARLLHLVPVDPDSQLVPAMQAGAFGLSHGRILVLFPEGERSIDGTVKKFKKGAPILAQHLGVPIVPVAITGVYELWPRNRPFNWRRAAPWSGHPIAVTFGSPITIGREDDPGEAASRLRELVDAMWNKRA